MQKLVEMLGHCLIPSSAAPLIADWGSLRQITEVMMEGPENSPSSAERLAALRTSDSRRYWSSLEDQRQCILCERIFKGRQVRIVTDRRRGKMALHCPTKDCPSTPREWVSPGDPLLDDEAWRDWLHILDDFNEKPDHSSPLTKSSTGFPD